MLCNSLLIFCFYSIDFTCIMWMRRIQALMKLELVFTRLRSSVGLSICTSTESCTETSSQRMCSWTMLVRNTHLPTAHFLTSFQTSIFHTNVFVLGHVRLSDLGLAVELPPEKDKTQGYAGTPGQSPFHTKPLCMLAYINTVYFNIFINTKRIFSFSFGLFCI